MHNFSISRVVSSVSRPRFPVLVFHSPFSVPEVNLSAMSGYLAPSNIAETQFDDDETGIQMMRREFRGFEYKEIILLLLKNHGIEMSLRTLKRRIKSYGLRRQQLEYNIDQVRASVPTTIDGHGSLQGYRSLYARRTSLIIPCRNIPATFFASTVAVTKYQLAWYIIKHMKQKRRQFWA